MIGDVTVDVRDGYTITTFGDGAQLYARHDEQPGQRATADELGYDSIEQMNVEHDVYHALLARWLGLRWSPTLRASSRGLTCTVSETEEAAVLAIQKFALTQ